MFVGDLASLAIFSNSLINNEQYSLMFKKNLPKGTSITQTAPEVSLNLKVKFWAENSIPYEV